MASVNTRISPTGHISRRIAFKKMAHRKATARMLQEVFIDITDGNNDNRVAAALVMQLQTLNLYEHDVEARQYDGDLAGAEVSADRYLLTDEPSSKSVR